MTTINVGFFADNDMQTLAYAAQFGRLLLPYGSGRNAPPSNEDIAAVIAEILARPEGHAGKTYRPTGPALLSGEDMAGILSTVLGRTVRYVDVPLWLVRRIMNGMGFSDYAIAQTSEYYLEYQRNAFAVGAPTDVVRRITGREPEDFEAIARRYAASLPEATPRLGAQLRLMAPMAAALLRPLPRTLPPLSTAGPPTDGASASARTRPSGCGATTFSKQSVHTVRGGRTTMASTTYLITAATGATGSAAVDALLDAGQGVRALAHREDERAERLRARGAEVVLGDLDDYGATKAALRGVDGAYFCYPIALGLVQATAQFAQAAREAGVGAVVNMSQVIAREDARSHAAFGHWLAERVFDWSGLGVTHLRPTFFAEWLLYFSPMIRQGTIYAPYGLGKAALIAAEDQGRVIARILQDPEPHKGKIYSLYGPVEYTFPEIAEALGRTLDKQILYRQVPFEVMAQAFIAGGEGVARNDALSGYAESNRGSESGESHTTQHLREAAIDHDNGLFSGTNDLVERITGRAPMTIEEYVSTHRAAFV